MGKPVHKDMVHYVFEIMIITKYLAPLISYWKILEQSSKIEKAQT